MASVLYQAQLNPTLPTARTVLGISVASEIHLFCFSNLMRTVTFVYMRTLDQIRLQDLASLLLLLPSSLLSECC